MTSDMSQPGDLHVLEQGLNEQRDFSIQPSNLDPQKCLLQEQSPLFGVLPAEIRNEIFGYCLSEQNGCEQIDRGEFFYRPEYDHYRWIDTVLLTVCRRIYFETRTIPVQNITFREWLGGMDRNPNRRTMQRRLQNSMFYREKLSSDPVWNALARPKHIQFFAQMFALEDRWYLHSAFAEIIELRCPHVTITIRHTDWYWWEDDVPLQMDEVLLPNESWPKCVETFTLELETRNGRRNMLDKIVRKIKKWTISLDDRDIEDQAKEDFSQYQGRFQYEDERDDSMSVGYTATDQSASEDEAMDDMSDAAGSEASENSDNEMDEDAISDAGESHGSQSNTSEPISEHIMDSDEVDSNNNDLEEDLSSESDISVDEGTDSSKYILASVRVPQTSTWIGSATIDGTEYTHHNQEYNDTTNLADGEMMYYVVKLKWRKTTIAQYKDERRLGQERKRHEAHSKGFQSTEAISWD